MVFFLNHSAPWRPKPLLFAYFLLLNRARSNFSMVSYQLPTRSLPGNISDFTRNLTGWIDPDGSAGFEPATFWIEGQRPNHCATTANGHCQQNIVK